MVCAGNIDKDFEVVVVVPPLIGTLSGVRGRGEGRVGGGGGGVMGLYFPKKERCFTGIIKAPYPHPPHLPKGPYDSLKP